MDRKLIDLALDQAKKQLEAESRPEFRHQLDCILENFVEEFNAKLNFIDQTLEIAGTPSVKKNSDFLDRPICDAIPYAHTANPLIKAGLRTVRDVAKKTSQELLEVKGFGANGLKMLLAVLNEHDVELGVKQKKLL